MGSRKPKLTARQILKLREASKSGKLTDLDLSQMGIDKKILFKEIDPRAHPNPGVDPKPRGGNVGKQLIEVMKRLRPAGPKKKPKVKKKPSRRIKRKIRIPK